MDNGFSVLMICFGIALLLYAGLIRWQGVDVIPRMYAVKAPYPKAFARNMAKIVAIIALSPIACGIVGLKYGSTAGLITLAVSLILVIAFCVWRFAPRKGDKDSPEE